MTSTIITECFSKARYKSEKKTHTSIKSKFSVSVLQMSFNKVSAVSLIKVSNPNKAMPPTFLL